jgi:hypothetical protein
VLVLGLLLGTGFPLALCGGLYACSTEPRQATEAYFAGVREGKPPYPLEPGDARDAEQTLAEIAKSSGFSLWNYQGGSNQGPERSCLLLRLTLPSGARWMEVALEKQSAAWRVRDVSFQRECDTSKHSGDFQLH